MALAIIIIICATALCMTVVIAEAYKKIQTGDSYWKAKYDIEHEDYMNIIELNADILANTKDVIRINKELHVMLNERFKKEE